MTTLKWVSSYIIGVCAIEICAGGSGLLVTSGIRELNEFDKQEQRAFAPDIILKSSPLRVNRSSAEAIREQQSLGTRIIHPQKKPALLTLSKVLSTTNFPPTEELDQEIEVNSADEDEKLSDDYEKEEEVLPTLTSTEIPKKKLVASVRPFRSRQDLVESLKRRRLMVQQRGNTSLSITSSSPTPEEKTQSKSTTSVRKYGNTKKSPNYLTTSDNYAFEKKPKSYKRRYGTQSTPLIVEEVVTEESNIISQAVAKGGRTKAHVWRTRKD